MSGDAWSAQHTDGEECERATTTRDCPRSHEYRPATPTLNDELAAEARAVALRSHADLARRGTRHDPDL